MPKAKLIPADEPLAEGFIDLPLQRLAEASQQARRKSRMPEPQTTALQPRADLVLPVWLMKITQQAYQEMLSYLSSGPPEMAGILLGPVADDALITHFIPDLTGESLPASFRLGSAHLNEEMKRIKPARMNCKGVAHSHPPQFFHPSAGDLAYLERLFALPTNAEAQQFFVPIIVAGRMYPYVFSEGRIWPTAVLLV